MPNQYKNKVIYNGTTLIDLTGDTAVAADVQSGKSFHLATGETVTGTSTKNADTRDANMQASELLSGKTGYGAAGTKITGTMPNNGGNNVTVSGTSGASIPAGYYDGSGKAVLDSTSATNLIAENIRDGVTILGVEGTMSGSEDVHAQAKTVTPTGAQQVIVPDSPTYNYLSQVTVAAIPYSEADNAQGGVTVTIGSAA